MSLRPKHYIIYAIVNHIFQLDKYPMNEIGQT